VHEQNSAHRSFNRNQHAGKKGAGAPASGECCGRDHTLCALQGACGEVKGSRELKYLVTPFKIRRGNFHHHHGAQPCEQLSQNYDLFP
jgi:hypothetical protein